MPPVHGQASGTAIALWILALGPGRPVQVASLLNDIRIRPAGENGRTSRVLRREGQVFVGFCVFSRAFNEANRGPRRATDASTGTSKPVAPAIQTIR